MTGYLHPTGSFGEVLGKVEGRAIERGVPGLDCAHANACADVALAKTGGIDDERATALRDEAQCGEVEDELLCRSRSG